MKLPVLGLGIPMLVFQWMQPILLPQVWAAQRLKTPAVPVVSLEQRQKDLRFELLNQLNRTACRKQAMDLLTEWKAESTQWMRAPTDMDGGKSFKAPTDRMGTWVEVSVYPNRTAELRLLSPEIVVRTIWVGAGCAPQINISAVEPQVRGPFEQLTDKDLEKLAHQGDSVMIYAWSPGMTLSVGAYEQARAIAERMKIKFLPVLDPHASVRSTERAQKRAKIPQSATRRIASMELAQRGMEIHYPATIVLHKGRFSGLFPGLWEKPEVLERFLKEATQ